MRIFADSNRYNQIVTSHDIEAELFRALAHPTRLRILELLRAASSLTVGESQQRLGLRAANVSQHLAVLRQSSLVSTRRDGTSIWYAIAAPGVTAVMDSARHLHQSPSETGRRLRTDTESQHYDTDT